ncbi:hypothetical protein BCR43DRAFT_499789 [Syncephalastrum racemosum]|uniref:Uncharacterized protein n=1 Tax=Syncephalastrum racemosum TaxID=13706 RepID=A0A1X2GZM1_SYNRA|nr:hypothetical protein BCR43DRAFT_499789 [Syncephalastrum racemosum]
MPTMTMPLPIVAPCPQKPRCDMLQLRYFNTSQGEEQDSYDPAAVVCLHDEYVQDACQELRQILAQSTLLQENQLITRTHNPLPQDSSFMKSSSTTIIKHQASIRRPRSLTFLDRTTISTTTIAHTTTTTITTNTTTDPVN